MRECPRGGIPNKESMTATVIPDIVPVERFPYQEISNNLSNTIQLFTVTLLPIASVAQRFKRINLDFIHSTIPTLGGNEKNCVFRNTPYQSFVGDTILVPTVAWVHFLSSKLWYCLVWA
jgi:hypothetical protein